MTAGKIWNAYILYLPLFAIPSLTINGWHKLYKLHHPPPGLPLPLSQQTKTPFLLSMTSNPSSTPLENWPIMISSITTSHLIHPFQPPIYKRSFQIIIESNGVKCIGNRCELDENEQPPTTFQTSISHSIENSIVKPSNTSSTYDFNLHIVDMGFPTVCVVKQPIMSDGTPALVGCGHTIIFNDTTDRHFMMVGIHHLTILSNHITYSVYDPKFERHIYMLVPWEWTMEDNC